MIENSLGLVRRGLFKMVVPERREGIYIIALQCDQYKILDVKT